MLFRSVVLKRIMGEELVPGTYHRRIWQVRREYENRQRVRPKKLFTSPQLPSKPLPFITSELEEGFDLEDDDSEEEPTEEELEEEEEEGPTEEEEYWLQRTTEREKEQKEEEQPAPSPVKRSRVIKRPKITVRASIPEIKESSNFEYLHVHEGGKPFNRSGEERSAGEEGASLHHS